MNPIDIIIKKRNKLELSYDEIKYMIDGFINDEIENYQMSSFLMAICINGMTFDETYYLTDVMLKSGDILDLSDIDGIKIDKHSTGGVGDKTTIALAPIVASLGVKFPKMSGRGLGHTGGTIDKLESIPGFNINLDEDTFKKNVNEIGAVICGQTQNLVPADKKLYALRDVTGTVESIPLIASSIMSKKLASGADVILLDIKVETGALMKKIDEAIKIARLMVELGKKYNKKVIATLTNMSTPLGNMVGNSLEVIEAIMTVKGEINNDFSELTKYFAAHIVSLSLEIDIDKAKEMVDATIKNGNAYKKLIEFVTRQGGDPKYIIDTNNFEKAKNVIIVKSKNKGYINNIEAFKIGHLACRLGAGRKKLGDKIDYSAGVELLKKPGDYVEAGDELLKLYTNYDTDDSYILEALDAYEFSDKAANKELIIDTIM